MDTFKIIFDHNPEIASFFQNFGQAANHVTGYKFYKIGNWVYFYQENGPKKVTEVKVSIDRPMEIKPVSKSL